MKDEPTTNTIVDVAKSGLTVAELIGDVETEMRVFVSVQGDPSG